MTEQLYYSQLGESNTKEGWLRFMLDSYKEMGIPVPNNHSWEKTEKLLQLVDYDPLENKRQFTASFGDIVFNRHKAHTEPLEKVKIEFKKPTKKKIRVKGKPLEPEIRAQIKLELEKGILSIREIASKFNLTTMTIHNVKNNKAKREEDNQRCKLSKDNIREILDLRKNTTYTLREIAEFYGVCYSNIQAIVKGKTWKHLMTTVDVL